MTLVPEDVKTALREIVVRNARIPVRDLDEDGPLAPQAGLDSLALVMTLAEVEDVFQITFPVDQVCEPGLLTFRDLLRIILAETGASG